MKILITKNDHSHYDQVGNLVDCQKVPVGDTVSEHYIVQLDSGEQTTVVENEFKFIRDTAQLAN
jgi:hypothetical protein